MKKWLLVWNIVITVLLVSLVANGCSALGGGGGQDAQIQYLQDQITALQLQVQQQANQNSQTIAAMQIQIAGVQSYASNLAQQIQVALAQLQQR
ncbi:MAG: hypothetical protein HYX79_02100 [Chloroflexi bacterium]|nr:hypothetical protein [Chloroflexota bacterium]